MPVVTEEETSLLRGVRVNKNTRAIEVQGFFETLGLLEAVGALAVGPDGSIQVTNDPNIIVQVNDPRNGAWLTYDVRVKIGELTILGNMRNGKSHK